MINYWTISKLINMWNFPIKIISRTTDFHSTNRLATILLSSQVTFLMTFLWQAFPVDADMGITMSLLILEIPCIFILTYFNNQAKEYENYIFESQIRNEIMNEQLCSRCNEIIDEEMQKALIHTDYIYCKACGAKLMKQTIQKVNYEEIMSDHNQMIQNIKAENEKASNIAD